MDFELARENMVHSQVRPSDVTDKRISGAMLSIPRESFVPANKVSIAYSDEVVPLNVQDGGEKRYLLEPAPLAKLIQLLNLEANDFVLEIGCATGYASAVLSTLSESVIAIEEDEKLVEAANQVLMEEGFEAVTVIQGKLNEGMPSQGPYDAIFINGAVEVVPQSILEQLKDDGRLVTVFVENGASSAIVFTRTGDKFSSHKAFSLSAPLLPGFAKVREFQF